MSNINNKEKYICKKCGAKFYIIKNPLKKCPTCKSTSIDKLEAIKLPLQVIYLSLIHISEPTRPY